MMRFLHTVVTSSLTHFLVVGGILFLLAPSPENQSTIVMSKKQLALMSQIHAKTLGVPKLTEQQSLEVKARWMQDALLYKEGRRMGLDKGDTIIKQRVIQKVIFLAQQLGGASSQVKDETLRVYFQQTRQRWRQPQRIHLVHIYLRKPSPQKWKLLREKLSSTKGVPRLGDSFLLGNELVLTSVTRLKSLFGQSFVTSCLKLSVGRWSGPIPSKYGAHLVKVVRKQPGRLLSFAEAKDQVLFDYLLTRKRNLRESYLKKLQQRYPIEWVP